ncbi:MAG: helix-turn-helix domain-containing protein [Pseudomonadota bacterium]
MASSPIGLRAFQSARNGRPIGSSAVESMGYAKSEAHVGGAVNVRTSAAESAKSDWIAVGQRLVSIRASMPQPAMAKRVGVSPTTYGRLERGEREIGADVLMRLAADGWNINWLLTGAGPSRLDDLNCDPQHSESQNLSAEHLSIALELADEALRGRWLPRRRYADLVLLIYQALTEGLPYAEILDFARPAAQTLGKEQSNEEPRLGETGPRTALRGAAATGE